MIFMIPTTLLSLAKLSSVIAVTQLHGSYAHIFSLNPHNGTVKEIEESYHHLHFTNENKTATKVK